MADMQASQIEKRFHEVRAEIGKKCAEDSKFRRALLANANNAIEEEYGLPKGALAKLKIKVVEEGADTVVIPIPPNPEDMELSDEQLENVAGGFAFTVAVTTAVVTAVGVGVSAVGITGGIVQGTRAGRSW